MYSKNFKVIAWVAFLLLCLSTAAWSKNPMMFKTSHKKAAAQNAENISLPKDLTPAEIDHFIAGLSDEQVRRLLLNDLDAQAHREALDKATRAKSIGIESFIDNIKNLTAALQTRIESLQSGSRGAQQEVSGVLTIWAGENAETRP